MTLPPESIGDKGQRYAVSAVAEDGLIQGVGYSDTEFGAQLMADAMREHPTYNRPMITDRRPDPSHIGRWPAEPRGALRVERIEAASLPSDATGPCCFRLCTETRRLGLELHFKPPMTWRVWACAKHATLLLDSLPNPDPGHTARNHAFRCEDYAETLAAIMTYVRSTDEPRLRAVMSNNLSIVIGALRIAEAHPELGEKP